VAISAPAGMGAPHFGSHANAATTLLVREKAATS